MVGDEYLCGPLKGDLQVHKMQTYISETNKEQIQNIVFVHKIFFIVGNCLPL